jgi:hypothetical protein
MSQPIILNPFTLVSVNIGDAPPVQVIDVGPRVEPLLFQPLSLMQRIVRFCVELVSAIVELMETPGGGIVISQRPFEGQADRAEEMVVYVTPPTLNAPVATTAVVGHRADSAPTTPELLNKICPDDPGAKRDPVPTGVQVPVGDSFQPFPALSV